MQLELTVTPSTVLPWTGKSPKGRVLSPRPCGPIVCSSRLPLSWLLADSDHRVIDRLPHAIAERRIVSMQILLRHGLPSIFYLLLTIYDLEEAAAGLFCGSKARIAQVVNSKS